MTKVRRCDPKNGLARGSDQRSNHARRLDTFLGCAAFVLSFSAVAGAQEIVLVRAGEPEAAITLAPGATAAEQRGAQELRDHLEVMSGVELGAVAPAGGGELRLAYDASLGPEEYRLKTEGRRLSITGGRPRGVLYGCTALLERLGVRWFTRTVTVVPKRQTVTLPPLDERGAPAFENRHIMMTEADDPQWAARNRLNGASKKLDLSYGGSLLIHPFVHSLDAIVPGELAAEHPDYFPMIDGKRFVATDAKHTWAGVQRCLTNPDVVKLSVKKVREWIREVPEAAVISVSQNDGDGWCECPSCRKVVDKYGARSGLLIAFVNEVAAAIEMEHPDKIIDTLAYGETEAPPKGISPRKNVRVRLCPIDVCHAHPLERCAAPASVDFLARLTGWDSLTDSLAMWHYNCFTNFLMPTHDFAGFPADLRLYRKHGVRSVFMQGTFVPGGGASDAELRVWVQARLLWNPDLDADSLVTEWMKGVYGAAWKPMRAWFDRQYGEALAESRHLYLQDAPTIFPEDLVAVGDELFDRAEKLADSAAARDAVAKARLPLRYVKLDRAKVPGSELDRFLAEAHRFGLTHIAEGQTIEEWETELRKRGK